MEEHHLRAFLFWGGVGGIGCAVIARGIILPETPEDDEQDTSAFWTEVIGQDKPNLTCKLSNGESVIQLSGMIDTGADATVISRKDWPLPWQLRPVMGSLTGIGGRTKAERSASPISIEGPDGNIASVRPFVVDAGFTLWGRDLLSQWGTQIKIENPQRDF